MRRGEAEFQTAGDRSLAIAPTRLQLTETHTGLLT